MGAGGNTSSVARTDPEQIVELLNERCSGCWDEQNKVLAIKGHTGSMSYSARKKTEQTNGLEMTVGGTLVSVGEKKSDTLAPPCENLSREATSRGEQPSAKALKGREEMGTPA